MPFRDDEFDELDEREFPEPDRADDGTTPCPYCGRRVYEDAEMCPACGSFIVRDDELREGERGGSQPIWVVVVATILLAFIIYFWI